MLAPDDGVMGEGGYDGDLGRELKMQDFQIEELSKQIQEYEESNELMRQQRPMMGQMPPIDHDGQQYYYDGQDGDQ